MTLPRIGGSRGRCVLACGSVCPRWSRSSGHSGRADQEGLLDQTTQSSDPEIQSMVVLARASCGVLRTLRERLVAPIVIPSHLTPTLPDWPSLENAQLYARMAHRPFDLLALDYDVAGLAYYPKSSSSKDPAKNG